MADTNTTTSTAVVLDSQEIQANSVADLHEVIEMLGGKAGILSTLPTGTQAERIAVAAAVSNSVAIADELGKTINVSHVIVQAVDMLNEQTGQLQTVPRVVFYDDKGVGHHAISGPLFRDARTMLGIVGDPSTWEAPVAVKVLQEGSGSRKYFTLKYV